MGRFIEQPRVLEGNAEAGREGTEQADVGVAESSLALHVLEGSDAAYLAASEQRHEHGRLGHFPLYDQWIAGLLDSIEHVVIDNDGRLGLVDLPAEAHQRDLR